MVEGIPLYHTVLAPLLNYARIYSSENIWDILIDFFFFWHNQLSWVSCRIYFICKVQRDTLATKLQAVSMKFNNVPSC